MDIEFLKNYNSIIGCDEVGRGPIAGPVCACAVKINTPELLESLIALNICDSKKLSEKKRNLILSTLGIETEHIQPGLVHSVEYNELSFDFVVSEIDHHEIDQINILQASLKAMQLSAEKLYQDGDIYIVDGNRPFKTSSPIECVIKGDSKLITIGLASIIAKNFRDEKMLMFDKLYPGYNFASHAGYPTKTHKEAVKNLGPSPIHRKTFKGVKEYL